MRSKALGVAPRKARRYAQRERCICDADVTGGSAFVPKMYLNVKCDTGAIRSGSNLEHYLALTRTWATAYTICNARPGPGPLCVSQENTP